MKKIENDWKFFNSTSDFFLFEPENFGNLHKICILALNEIGKSPEICAYTYVPED